MQAFFRFNGVLAVVAFHGAVGVEDVNKNVGAVADGDAGEVRSDGLAKVAVAEKITDRASVSGETIRTTLQRMGVNWTRAKGWIHSPDPAYAAKKAAATG